MEDNESFQLLLSEKTLNGDFSKTDLMHNASGTSFRSTFSILGKTLSYETRISRVEYSRDSLLDSQEGQFKEGANSGCTNRVGFIGRGAGIS